MKGKETEQIPKEEELKGMIGHEKIKELPKEEDTAQLKKELEEQKKLVGDYVEHMIRLQAEFENYQKRVDRERDEFVRYANEKLILELLNIVDDFERAIPSLREKGIDTTGIVMIYTNFMKILENEGLKKIDCIGKKFDPYYHEVILQEEAEKEDGTITEELQKGYMLNSKVLRHSKVKISKKPFSL